MPRDIRDKRVATQKYLDVVSEHDLPSEISAFCETGSAP